MVIAKKVDELLQLCKNHEKNSAFFYYEKNIFCEGELASSTKLDFTGEVLGDAGVAALAHALRSMKHLEWLSLKDNKMGPEGARALAPVLEELREMKYLDLGHEIGVNWNKRNKIGAQGARALAPALEKMGSLQHLDLRWNGLKVEGALALAPALEKMRSLQHLDLWSNGLKAEGVLALTPALKMMSSLQHLDLSDNMLKAEGALDLAPSLEKMGSLQHLDLSDNILKAEGVLALAPALVKMGSLQHLDLDDNDLKAEGALALAPALLEISSLEKISLGVDRVESAFLNCISCLNGASTKLDLSRCNLNATNVLYFIPALEKMGSLQHLNLSLNDLKAEGALALAPSLEKMGSLLHLDLSLNDLKAEGALVLAPSLEKMGSLQHLNLWNNDLKAKGALALAPALEKMGSLQHLDLSDNILKAEGVLALAPTLLKISSLEKISLGVDRVESAFSNCISFLNGASTKLDLSRCNLNATNVLYYIPALEKMSSLQHLDLSDNMLKAEGVLALAPALVKMGSLQHLDIGGNYFEAEGALALAPTLEKMGSLLHLDLSLNDLKAEGALALASSLEKMGSLQHLNLDSNYFKAKGALALAPALEKMGSLLHLDLSYNDLNTEGALALAPALEKMGSLQHLNLRANDLKAEGALALAPALEKMGSLQHLDLSWNEFKAEGALAFAPALLRLSSLKSLDLGMAIEKAILRVLNFDSASSKLDLSNCGLDGTNARFFIPHLEKMGSLQLLNLGYNDLKAEGALALAPALEKMGSLQHLNLCANDLKAEGALALALALEKMSSLQHLDLRSNSLGPEGARTLVPALEKMGSIEHLDLNWNDFKTEGALALAPALLEISSLEKISLGVDRVERAFLNFISCLNGASTELDFLELPLWGFSTIPLRVLKLLSLETLIVSKYRGALGFLSIITSAAGYSDDFEIRNCIESLPADIGDLSALRRLEVVGGNISTLPSSIANLKQLNYMDLRGNPFIGLPDGRGILVENRILNLSSRGMTDIPKWVWRLRWIHTLSLSRNPLSATTSFAKLSRFQDLTSLDLSHLGLSSLYHITISSLPRLATLDLSHNSLNSFPLELSDLPSLSSLNLSQNPISVLPPEFLSSSTLETLVLFPNEHLSAPPPSIAKQGLQGMRTYFEELEKGSQSLVHMKLLLLGDAEMGKTTLFEALTTGKGKCGWRPRTFGIDVRFWDIAHLRESTSGFFSVWDFAGQEDYVAAHSLFVGEAVVLLVVRLDAEPPFMKYLARWLDSLAVSVKSKTPFMVIGTHADRLWSSQKDAALSRLRAELSAHGYEIGGDLQGNLELLDVIALSSTKARGVPDLRNRLVDLASERYCELYPSSYWDLHAAVRKASMHRPVVKWSQFWQQSQLLRSTAATEETVLQMTKVLHEWGSVLFFEEMEEQYVVLNPQWLAKCVAKVVSSDEFVNADGMLPIRTWMEHGPRPAHFLLSLLQRFGIVCALNMESCLVPCRLKSSRPSDFQIRWPSEVPLGLESRRLFYRFERAAPRGFFSHLMARCLSRPEHYDSIYWDRGLVVRDGASGCMACVLSEPFQVVLKVRGHGDSVEELLRWLVSTTELLRKEVFPMTSATWISPCCCSSCGTQEVPACTWLLEELERRAEGGEVSVSHGEEQMLLISLGVRAHWKPEVQTSPVPVIAPSSLFQHLITDEWEWDGVKVNVIPLQSSVGLLEKVSALWKRSEEGEKVAVPSAVCLRPPCLVFPPWPKEEVTGEEIHFENGLVLSLSFFNSQ